MPIYEYICQKCGRKTEVIQRMDDAPPAKCPHCGGKVKKAISAPAIQFKGSGWYVTDYGSGATNAGRSEREAGESGEKSSDKSDKSDKSEKAEKADRADKAAKSEKSERSEKSDKSDKSEKKKSSRKRS